MFTQQQTLLRQFDEGLRPEIVEFGKRIRRVSGEVDVVIFMARKAACFAEALRLVRLTAYQSITTSNRVLDMSPAWLEGRSVAIIDDALITGTELYRTIERVRQYAKSVQVHVLAVNRNWNADLVKPDSRYLELDDEECALICANIVDAISLIPLPYSTDYPLYSGFRVKREYLRPITHLDSWRCMDVTSSLQSRYSVFSKTICPEESTLRQINYRLGANLSANALIRSDFTDGGSTKSERPFGAMLFPSLLSKLFQNPWWTICFPVLRHRIHYHVMPLIYLNPPRQQFKTQKTHATKPSSGSSNIWRPPKSQSYGRKTQKVRSTKNFILSQTS